MEGWNGDDDYEKYDYDNGATIMQTMLSSEAMIIVMMIRMLMMMTRMIMKIMRMIMNHNL